MRNSIRLPWRFCLANLLGLALCMGVLLLMTGCSLVKGLNASEKLAEQQSKAQTQMQEQKDKDAAELKLNQYQLGQKLLEAEAQADPAKHPIEVGNLVIRKIEPWLVGLAIISAVLFVLGFGLAAYLGKVGVVFIKFGVRAFLISTLAAICLPFFPTGIYCFIVGGVIWLIVECIIHKSVPAGISAVESDVESAVGEITPATGTTTTGATPSPLGAAIADASAVLKKL